MELLMQRETDHEAFSQLYRASALELEEDWLERCHPVCSFSVREGSELLGAATLSRRMERWILDYIAVIPAARGRGIGRLLVEACLDWCRRQNADCLWLAARTPGFFAALGAVDTGGTALLGECLDCPDHLNGCDPKEMRFFW